MTAWIVTLLACTTAPAPPAAPLLSLPIDCDVGADCWFTSRPDHDPGPGVKDHTGGTSTYDGHDGTDLAVRDVGQADATWVLAPATGTVLRARDDVPDGELLAGRSVDGHECGNGVVLDADGGWELQLCHMRLGTVVVHAGDHVDVGARLGRVGWSGDADHPHVHLTVRKDGRKVDPFDGSWLDDGSPAADGPLWARPMPRPDDMDALVWAGFDAGPPPPDDPWPIDGERGVVPATATSLALGVFLWRPEAGDVVRIAIQRPDGTITHSQAVEPRNRPRETWWVEKTWPADQRPVGLWTATVEWERKGRTRTIHASTVLK